MSINLVTIADTKELRFEFGKNWKNFLNTLNEERIVVAEKSLLQFLGETSLTGKTFLDIGCGSGLFSLAARRLGAKVHSFDYDTNSVGCTQTLRDKFYPHDLDWTIEQGSVLDETYMATLGSFDIVYSWGVLHHTGAMWKALKVVSGNVTQNGKLFIAIYNDQGRTSKIWLAIKRGYNKSPSALRLFYLLLVAIPREFVSIMMALLSLNIKSYIHTWTRYKSSRGMNRWHDIVDWIGGLPFEVAKPEEIFDFYYERGFRLLRLKTCAGGLGCNEYVFERCV
jgi:2-polyprenyl-3-methyl-5-hydroxy-6-metoxy-1,4-benzoquinol methylase